MKRYRPRKPAVGVSLFPFLAVLICTMGALIVLLVMVVQMARVDASETTPNLLPPLDPQARDAESYRWRQGLLEQQDQQLRQDAERNRLELSHLEQHIRELEREWKQLVARATDLKQRTAGRQTDHEADAQRLAEVQTAIEQARRDLERMRREVAQRAPVYAVVPYAGPRGTRREPIYLECTAQGVRIQPDNVLISLNDFQGPLSAGNPLDAALRAIRQQQLTSTGSAASAYPLLIVRPDGAEAYAAARAAMRTWDDEFGYELVDEGLALQYPAVDPQRKPLVERVIQDARSRQAILAAAMPSRFDQHDQQAGFVASPTRGGFVARDPAGQSVRRGGFGTGGDARYRDGYSRSRQVEPVGADAEQTIGGSDQEGTPGGDPRLQHGESVEPLAHKRGMNWGLPNVSANATGIVRPLRVACLRDRLILLPDKNERRAPEVILIEGAMLEEVDTFVGKIWDRIDQWGIAVAGGYWKPVLQVDVAQGAESRFEELATLLMHSGLQVERNSRETTPVARR